MAIIPVKHKRSNVSGKVPTVNELPLGEIAINTADGILYLKTENDGIVSITAIQASNETIVLSGDVSGTGSSLINVTLASSGVVAGTYNNSATAITPITIDAKGRVTSTGAAVTITPAFSSITGKPTNLAGYGINDAQPLDSDLTAIAALTGTSGLLRKTAADTWSLDTNTYLTGNQTIVISGDASGSGATTISLTLANSGVSTGTYTKVTVDAKGRVTAGAFLTASDIPDLVASKITDFDTQVRTNRLDQMAAPTGSVSLNSQRITSLATPTSDSDAATKAYVDAVKQGLDIKDSVRAATTANIVLSGTQTVDGVALVAGDRVLVKDQVSASTNGIYVVAIGAWDRAHDANTSSKAHAGIFTFVAEGTVNADSGWVLTTNDPITLGTTALTFTQFSGAGQITAGDGLTKSGNTLNVVGTSGRIVANADSIDLASNVIGTTGTYRSVTVDTYGRVTAGTNPTNLAGYGITDAQPLDADLTAIAGLAGTTGLLRKTAADSWSLDTNSYLTGNQSISISGDASGSGATSISLTLANSGVTAGTYNNSATSVTPITVDAKGRITGVGTAVTITPAFSSVTGKPTSLAGYGITDAATSTHTHGNITNAGAIGSTANLPIITTTSGVLTTGSFGNTANTFCQGNDARLSDTRNTTNSLAFNNGGAGSASGTAFNGSSAVTVSYNTVGAPSTTGANASGTWGINITGSSASCTGNSATATSATSATVADSLSASDNRVIAPNEIGASRAVFGFTSWANNNTSPYADYIHFRGWTDSSGGNDNLLMLNRNALGIRIWQQSYGSATAYSTYKDVCWTDGTNASGSWAINVTGSSASCTGNAATATTATNLSGGTISATTGSFSGLIASAANATTFVDANDTTISVRSNGSGPAVMSFHRPGVYAVNFGLDTDNVLKVGGWSMGAVKYPILHSNNYNSYAPTLTGGGASGTWGINVTGSSASCTGNAATATTATNLSGFTNSNSGSPISGADALTNNGIAYVNNISLYSQTDGALYTQAYSTHWIHQIYGDYRTGQIAVRGKQSNAWQNWRAVLDSGNYTSYAPSLTGTGASGTWGINVTGSSASSPLLSGLGSYVWLASTPPSGYNMGIQCSFAQGADGWQSYGSVLTMKTYSGGGGSLQMYVPYSPTYGGTGLQVRFGNYDTSSGNSWTGWKTLLASDNYNSYSPTLTGAGASGTWAINITGDASTLDGLDSNRFMRSSGHPGYGDWGTFGNAQQTVYEIYQENFNIPYNTGSSNFPTNRGYSYGTLINFGANSEARAQIYISHAGNDLIFRGGWGTGSWQTWNRVWTDINDGHGSGLNADLLDDLHATSFLRTDVDFPTLSRTGAYFPQFITENTTNDATASYHIFKKTRAGGALVNGDALGTVIFQGNVATNNTVNTNAFIAASVYGSPNAGTGYLPVAVNIGSGERLRMDFANTGVMFELTNGGNCGIAGLSATNETFRIGRKITGNTGSSSGFVNYGSPDVTGDNNMYLSYPVWQANKAVGPTIGFRAANAARATGATATTHFGFYCDDIISGQNGTWGFYSNINEESGFFRRNFYADGNAPNFFKGNVGIGGQTSPSWPLEVQKSLNGEAFVQIANLDAGTSAVAGLRLLGTSSRYLDLKIAAASSFGILYGSGITTLYYDIDTHIWRNNAGAERGRFTSGGFFKASNTSSYLNSAGTFHELRSNTNNSVALYLSHVGTSGTQYGALIETANDQNDATRYFLSCYGSTTQRATIRSNGGFANYQALNVNLSDINTKKDISPIAETWNCVKEWEIVNYRYKDQPEEAVLNVGVIAQQVAESCPEVVTIFQEAEDETDEKPAKEELLGVKEQQMYWMAIKALQEAQVRIEALEAKVAALEK